MTLLSTLFPNKNLISRTVYDHDGGTPFTVTAPPHAGIIRVSMVGGGAQNAGAAFARTKTTCTPGETFTLAIGLGDNGGAGVRDTTLTRNTGSVILCRAAGATPNTAGSVAGSVGDVKRAGTVGSFFTTAGGSAGDDADPHPLGYGGSGAFVGGATGNEWRAAYYGAGGFEQSSTYPQKTPAGHGRATVEFFATDPGY